MNEKDTKKLLEGIDDLKKLLILQLFGQGVKQKQIAQMLGISEATMSRMIPRGVVKASGKKDSASPRSSEETADG